MIHPDEQEIASRLDRLRQMEPDAVACQHAVDHVRTILLEAPTPRISLSPRTRAFLRAAVILFFLGGLAMLISHSSPPGTAASPFVEVQRRVATARSLTYLVTDSNTLERGKPDRIWIQRSHRMRVESPGGQVRIIDLEQHRVLALNTKKKQAQFLRDSVPSVLNVYDIVDTVQTESMERLPDVHVVGKHYQVYLALATTYKRTQDVEVWVDAATGLPVSVNILAHTGKEWPDDGERRRKPSGGDTKAAMLSEIEIDKEVDARLFSLEPPSDYMIEGIGPVPAEAEKNLRAPEMKPLVGIGPARFGMSKEQLIQIFGPPLGTGKGVLDYSTHGFRLSLSSRWGLVEILCGDRTSLADGRMVRNECDFQGKTKEGIGIGSTSKELEATFGKPDVTFTEPPGPVRLSYHKLNLDVSLADGKVVQFTMRAPAGSAGR
jgi:hypothetical protein